jgi:hypothetical protein
MPFELDDSPQLKKGTGSFSVPRDAVQSLLERNAAAWQIGAYLTLARYTNSENKFCTASLKAIYKATGASDNKNGTASRIVDELLKMQCVQKKHKRPFLIYRPEEWHKLTKEVIPDVPHELHKIRFVLNQFDSEDRVWFPVSLIDGVGKFTQPLKALKQCGDVAARLLLLFYANNNMSEFGGVPPYPNAYRGFKLMHQKTTNGFDFWTASSVSHSAFHTLALPVLGLKSFSKDEDEKESQWKLFWNALASLENRGFINEIITVLDGPPDKQDSRPIYILSTRSKHSKPDTSLDAAPTNDRLFEKVTSSKCADSLGRFRDSFPVITRAGIQSYVAGIYRLHFRINNKRNAEVSSSWLRIVNEFREHESNLKYLAGQFDVEIDWLPDTPVDGIITSDDGEEF